VSEKAYSMSNLRAIEVSVNPKALQRTQTLPAALAYKQQSAPSLKACASALSHRRSDAASARLNPDGVFKDICVSIFGIDDSRAVQAITHQVVDNGGTVVDFTKEGQFACICADGVRPMSSGNIRLVSTRWINDCLAHGELIHPDVYVIYSPSKSQLPLLLLQRVYIYTCCTDAATIGRIRELSKLCGMVHVDSQDRIKSVTHFLVPDESQATGQVLNRAKARKKHVITQRWLEDTYLLGVIQDESSYAIIGDCPALGN
jgi:hypothetical protein